MITEDYANFEIVISLRDKGFDEPCYACYQYFKSSVTLYQGWTFEYKGYPVKNSPSRIKCPTLQMVVKWFREVHHIDICICRELDTYGKCFNGYIAVIYKDDCYKVTIRDATKDLTFEEAANKAIKYGLTLI